MPEELPDYLTQPIGENTTTTDYYVKLVEQAVDEWEEAVAPITENFVKGLAKVFENIEAASLDAPAIKYITERSLLAINTAEERMMAKFNKE